MGEVVVVTGATSGIGRAVAQRFARDGAYLALVARGGIGLEAAVRDVERAGGEAIALPTDVADFAQVEAAAAATEERFGPIDVWVNDAMTTIFAYFSDVSPEEFERATKVTYLGFVWGTKAALDRMLPRDRGVVMQVGSALAYRGIPLQSPYCGAKHAIKGFTESVRTELRHLGSHVHVGMVQLPGVNTPQFDHCRSKMGRHPKPVAPVYEPEVAADAVHWAVRHRRRELWVGIPTVYTVLGNRVSKALLERYLALRGVEGQLEDRPPTPENRSGNLFEPLSGDPGAHGPFDDRAHRHSVQQAFARHRALAWSVPAGLAAALTTGPLRSRHRNAEGGKGRSADGGHAR